MVPLKASSLRKRPARIRIKEEDRKLLIRDVKLGKVSSQVGFEDAERTFDTMIRELGVHVSLVPIRLVEAALWSSNLLDEIEEWKHPQGIPFDQWVESLLPEGLVFNKFWNTIEIG